MIFCKPRHYYQSYTDFWEMVDLCGYETIFIDEIDMSKRKSILLPGLM